MSLKIGLIINPVAGLGGSVALKGSDDVAKLALERGASAKAMDRAGLALKILQPYSSDLVVITAPNLMGQNLCQELGFNHQVVEGVDTANTALDLLDSTAQDTINVAKAIKSVGVDVLVFVGGDGTARNIFSAVGEDFPVLGIPAGVKIHSSVYAITPVAAGKILELLITNQLVTLMDADVMDIDETLFRQGQVKARRYGEMQVPAELRYMQAVKMGGKESDELVLADIAADVINQMDEQLFVIGSGSTTEFLMEELGLTNTLLGVDLIQDQQLVASDVTEAELLAEIYRHQQVKLVITLIGGQGHIFGRGNQQLSPKVIRAIGRDNLIIIATKTKLEALNHRALIADTGDSELDNELAGYIKVTTGYNDYVMYQIENPERVA
jgi:predicted polyphosphate/ATP-dependent NAD kinase